MNVQVASIRMMGVMLSLAVAACGADEQGSTGGVQASFVAGGVAAADVGLPTYPGAKPYTHDDNSSDSANVDISTPLFGLKVVAVQLESADDLEKVAAYYRQALSKYGPILECSDAAKRKRKTEVPATGDDELTCDPDEPGSHKVVYKVGTDKNQRIVALKPHGRGTQFSLVHVDTRGESDE
jgi:hypothetical protein